jgi:hypothetical protein
MCRSVYVDFEKFKTETGLEDYDVKELYKGFMDELLDAKDKLLAQLDKDDFEKMEKTVHNIKGISSSYMADSVFACSLELGRVLSSNDRPAVVSATNDLTEAIMKAAGDIFIFVRS